MPKRRSSGVSACRMFPAIFAQTHRKGLASLPLLELKTIKRYQSGPAKDAKFSSLRVPSEIPTLRLESVGDDNTFQAIVAGAKANHGRATANLSFAAETAVGENQRSSLRKDCEPSLASSGTLAYVSENFSPTLAVDQEGMVISSYLRKSTF